MASTALACAVGTTLFALATRLPFAIGPGIVPASIVASFLAGGMPLGVVLGIEVLAGLLTVVATNSLALTIFILFAAYPVIAWRLGQPLRKPDLAAAAAGAAMLMMVLR